MDLKINIETENNETHKWVQRHERLTTLKTRTIATLRDDNNTIIMDSLLYEAAQKGDVDRYIDALEHISMATQQPLEMILDHLSPSGNTLLHAAASCGSSDVVEAIIRHFPGHVGRKNAAGDTALHFACRGGWVKVSQMMVKHGIGDDDDDGRSCWILREKNQYGNTALHEAVLNQHVGMVDFLVNRAPEVRFYQNEEGKCPLYLAVELGNLDILRILCKVSSSPSSTYAAIKHKEDSLVEEYNGQSPIYAAIKHRKLDMLEELVKEMPQLISCRDENGGTPLHYAAFVGDLDGLRFILGTCTSLSLQRDQNGFYPLHIACQNGHVKMIQELLPLWPDPTELHNNKGQNILHVASKHGKDDAVKYLLKFTKLQKLLNEKDSEGNTPLHLATIHCHPKVLLSLTWDDKVDLKIANKECLTALDLALEQP